MEVRWKVVGVELGANRNGGGVGQRFGGVGMDMTGHGQIDIRAKVQ